MLHQSLSQTPSSEPPGACSSHKKHDKYGAMRWRDRLSSRCLIISKLLFLLLLELSHFPPLMTIRLRCPSQLLVVLPLSALSSSESGNEPDRSDRNESNSSDPFHRHQPINPVVRSFVRSLLPRGPRSDPEPARSVSKRNGTQYE